MKKVLHIIDSLGLGGTQTIVKGIFEEQKNNKNIFLYALRKRKINIEINHKNTFIKSSNKKYSLTPINELKELIKKEKIDILHCHLFRSQFFGWILKKLFFPNIKLIFHEHGQIFSSNSYYNKFTKIAEKQTNLFIAVSKATKQELIKKAKINHKKIKVLHNFVNLNKFNKRNIKMYIRKEKKKLGIKKEEFVIGFMGRLSKIKGCRYLIESLPHLNFKYKCLISGEGTERKKLEKLVKKLEIEDKVIFLGYINKPENVYPLLDILVMPSLNESFGLSVIEAQNMKIPVIASNIKGLNEIIINGKSGLSFKSKNNLDLAFKIKNLYNNKKLRKKLIINGLQNTKKYSFKEYLKNLNKILEKLN